MRYHVDVVNDEIVEAIFLCNKIADIGKGTAIEREIFWVSSDGGRKGTGNLLENVNCIISNVV